MTNFLRKYNFKLILRIAVFLLVLLVAVQAAGWVLRPLSNQDWTSSGEAGGIFAEPHNTLDVIVVGDSNSETAVSPMQWYEEYGFAAYEYGAGWLSVYDMYYMLKDILEIQSPKVVVLCTSSVYEIPETITHAERMAAETLEYYLPLTRFHDEWKKLTDADSISRHFQGRRYTWISPTKGYAVKSDCHRGDAAWDNSVSTSETEPIDPMVQLYLKKIIALCRKDGATPVFVTVPSQKCWTVKRHNGINAFAQAQDVDYYDYNTQELDPDIDWIVDTTDFGTHLNLDGAWKLTDALGKILADFDLPDHRPDPDYVAWEDCEKEYDAQMADRTPVWQEEANRERVSYAAEFAEAA